MAIVSILLLILCVTSALLLVIVVLLQDEEGEGLGGLFSGASSTPFGSRSGNVLTKFTSIVAAVFLVGVFGLAWINRSPDTDSIVGRARMESLRQSQGDWWVDVEDEGTSDASVQADGPADEEAQSAEDATDASAQDEEAGADEQDAEGGQ